MSAMERTATLPRPFRASKLEGPSASAAPTIVPGTWPEPETGAEVLRIEDLHVEFRGAQGPVRAVSGVNLALAAGRTLCLVGESGCGKTVTGLAVMGLLPPKGRIAAGRISFAGRTLDPDGYAAGALRGREIAMIFQNPTSSLNPVHSIGAQLGEVLTLHRGLSRDAARMEAARLLGMVGIPDPKAQLRRFPHQLSGGMAQRAMIAIALACRPRLLIADEPTTALDVTIQAQILDLLRNVQAELGMAILMITHDLGIVAEMADEVAVMYAGRVVESAPAKDLFARPAHPYTRGLMASRPRIDRRAARLEAIPGAVPPPHDLPPGCLFAPRCAEARPACRGARPGPVAVGSRHVAACHLAASA